MKLWKIIYSKKYRNEGCKYHGRHCVVIQRASGRPFNVLVQLRGKELVVVPWGNLRKVYKGG